MEDVLVARGLVGQLALLCLVGCGFAMILGARRWAGRLFLLGLLAAGAGSLVGPGWLP